MFLPFLKRDRNYIAGEWIEADGGKTFDVLDPATGETIGAVPDCGAAETRRAIEAANAAFESFRKTTASERARMLRALADAIDAHEEGLAYILTREQGKPLGEARYEIGLSAAYIRWFAEEARRVYGDVIPSPWPDRKLLVTKEPVGVVAAITPWNFPTAMLSRKIGPAIAAGCTSVVKPAPQTPYSGIAWAALCEMAGIPPGVVNVVTGDAEAIGAELTSNPLVRKITFTGSTDVGKLLMRQGADTMKRLSLELGGNAPLIVFEDADIEKAVEGAMVMKYRVSGQTCLSVNRTYVHEKVHDRFVEALAEKVGALKLGSGTEPGVDQGPLIDEAAVRKVESFVADAVDKGGKLVIGGKRHVLGGNFFEPTIISGATAQMRLAREEIFGPVCPVFTFSDEREAIAIANDTQYGLGCYFYTRDLGRAFRVADAVRYGMVGINETAITTEVAPFGGVKESGLGREGSRYGMDEYLDVKYVCVGGIGA